MYSMSSIFFFFFQAEDGIRDLIVTGVQTCALPIFIDLSDRPRVRPSLFVGPHPSAMALRGTDLFVALAGSNGVARVDVATGRVMEQLTVALTPRAPVGSDPNALALAPDGRTLYVAMAGNNAVAVVRLEPRAMRVAGLIPVGWYPTAVAVSADGSTLYVANGDRKSTRLNSSHDQISYAVFCLKKKNTTTPIHCSRC